MTPRLLNEKAAAEYLSLPVASEFPAEFERAAKLSREIGCRLARLKDERVFIDEIPADHPTTDPIAPACDFLCHINGATA